MDYYNIYAISDTHCFPLTQILGNKSGNILIHSGDALGAGTVQEWSKFKRYLKEIRLNWKRIIYVPGNHDRYVEANPSLCDLELHQLGVDLLLDKEITIDKLRIYGSPWTPEFNNWSFQLYDTHEAQRKWKQVPDNIDILITHGPPAGILSGPFGDTALRDEILQRIKPKVHIFGHIHSFAGKEFNNNIKFYNAACLTESYHIQNAGTEIII